MEFSCLARAHRPSLIFRCSALVQYKYRFEERYFQKLFISKYTSIYARHKIVRFKSHEFTISYMSTNYVWVGLIIWVFLQYISYAFSFFRIGFFLSFLLHSRVFYAHVIFLLFIVTFFILLYSLHIICNSEYYIPNSEFENCQLTKIAGKKSAYVTQRNENGLAREEEPLFFWELLILQIEGSIQRSRITPIKANRVEKDRRKYGGNRFTPWGASKSELTSSLDFCRKCHCFIAKIVLSHLPQISIIVYFYLCVSVCVYNM